MIWDYKEQLLGGYYTIRTVRVRENFFELCYPKKSSPWTRKVEENLSFQVCRQVKSELRDSSILNKKSVWLV